MKAGHALPRLSILNDGAIVGGSAASSRVAVLAFIAGLGHAFDFDTYVSLLFAIGVSLSMQMFLDLSGVSAQFAQFRGEYSGRSLMRAGMAWGIAVWFLIVVSVVGAGITGGQEPGLLVAYAGLGTFAGGEVVARHLRWVWQAQGKFAEYARVDLWISAVRLGVAALAVLTGSLALLAGSGVLAGCVLVAIAYKPAFEEARVLWEESPVIGAQELIRTTLPVSATTAMSVVHSQLPVLLLGWQGRVDHAAGLSVALRLPQASEILPVTIASIALPRVNRHLERFASSVFGLSALALVAGSLVALMLWILIPVLAAFLNYPEASLRALLGILLFALPFKFLNHQLLMLTIVARRTRARLAATTVTALFAANLLLLESRSLSSIAQVMVASEILYAVLLAGVLVVPAAKGLGMHDEKQLSSQEGPLGVDVSRTDRP